jgi:hypothetical protein
MPLRPLSQSGLRHIAKNASQRPIGEDGTPTKRTVLDAFNDKQAERYLHPTKGWRYVSAKRSIAALSTAEMKADFRSAPRVKRSKTYKPNGKRECARRVRQMGGSNV